MRRLTICTVVLAQQRLHPAASIRRQIHGLGLLHRTQQNTCPVRCSRHSSATTRPRVLSLSHYSSVTLPRAEAHTSNHREESNLRPPARGTLPVSYAGVGERALCSVGSASAVREQKLGLQAFLGLLAFEPRLRPASPRMETTCQLLLHFTQS
jgi:hypothetical protein